MFKTFYSKRDWGMGILIWGPFLFLLGLGVYSNSFGLITFSSLSLILLASLWFGTKYSIEDNKLIVQVGPFQYSAIPITSIQEIKRVKNYWSAPACSTDRLEINYNSLEHIVISPQHQDDFLKQIHYINSSITIT